MDTEVRVFHIYYTHYRYMYIYHRVNDAQIVREFIKKSRKIWQFVNKPYTYFTTFETIPIKINDHKVTCLVYQEQLHFSRYNVVPLIKATIQDMVTVFQGKWIIINFKAYCSYSKYNTLLHDFSVKNMFLEKTYCNIKAIHGYKGYRYEMKNFLWEFIVRILGFFTRSFSSI